MHISHRSMRSARIAVAAMSVLALCTPWVLPATAEAVSSWSPTLLVNTESFQEIDSGDGTTNIELRFGTTSQTLKFLTNGKFQFSRGLSVQGNLSGSTLRVDGNADVWGALGVSGATILKSTATISGNTKVRANLSGSTLNVDGNAGIYGALTTSGSIATKSNLTINADADTNDAVFTFGNQSANQTLKFLSTPQKFEFSKGIIVRGTMSGQTLNVDGSAFIYGTLSASGAIKTNSFLSGATLSVDGTTTLRSLTYTWPGAHGASGTVLGTNGAGVLTWTRPTVSNGSGGMLSLHPQFPNAVYSASGSTSIGQLTQSGAMGTENLYRWTTSRGTLQDYWVATRVQVPKNFSTFTSSGGITLRLRTGTASASDNFLTFRMLDTNNNPVAVTNNAQLVSAAANAWRTVNIGNVTSGTYTPLGYIKLLIKLAATSAGHADLSNIDLRWSTTTP